MQGVSWKPIARFSNQRKNQSAESEKTNTSSQLNSKFQQINGVKLGILDGKKKEIESSV